mmetsp:Transcript_47034/g.100403  ORF Transcript_47034/g.100403 Transcript_47034/m.100403 type:complete len:234 (-) Transcript_47034:455-1156(-)
MALLLALFFAVVTVTEGVAADGPCPLDCWTELYPERDVCAHKWCKLCKQCEVGPPPPSAPKDTAGMTPPPSASPSPAPKPPAQPGGPTCPKYCSRKPEESCRSVTGKCYSQCSFCWVPPPPYPPPPRPLPPLPQPQLPETKAAVAISKSPPPPPPPPPSPPLPLPPPQPSCPKPPSRPPSPPTPLPSSLPSAAPHPPSQLLPPPMVADSVAAKLAHSPSSDDSNGDPAQTDAE